MVTQLWLPNDGMKLRTQSTEMRFICRAAGLCHSWSSVIWKGLRLKLLLLRLHVEMGMLRRIRLLVGISFGCLPSGQTDTYPCWLWSRFKDPLEGSGSRHWKKRSTGVFIGAASQSTDVKPHLRVSSGTGIHGKKQIL